jgi:hypothetical protein
MDLENLYKVALKNEAAARIIAARINSKLAGALTRGLPDILGDTPITPQIDSNKVKELEARLDNVQQMLENYTDKVYERIGKINELAQNAVKHDDICNILSTHTESLQDTLKQYVSAKVIEAVRANTPMHLTMTPAPDAPKQDLGLVHYKTPQILQTLQAGVNVYLHGPSGSGKTTAAQTCASAIGVAFYFAAKIESEYLLLGFKDARGDTVRTQFREAYEHGGVFLFDEIDASSPAAVVAMNAALANGICPFPDGTVTRHKDFYCIAAGNTKLTGANRQYSGRAQLDATSVDRFAFIEFGYDEQLERALATVPQWALHVQELRKIVKERALNHLITPRATLDGCRLLQAGFSWGDVENMVCFKGLEADTVKSIKQGLKKPIVHQIRGR